MAGLLDWLRGGQPDDQQDPMARSVLFGDPEAAGAAQASQAMEPVTGPYLHDVLSGKMADDNMPRSTYDPNLSLAQNTRQPGALDAAMNIAMGIGPGAIRAYHGSPYDFSKFDLSKIGTGEGAQAYGHGLYFAESPGVAQSYRDALAQQPQQELGRIINQTGVPSSIFRDEAARQMRNSPALAKFAEDKDVLDLIERANRGIERGGTVTDDALRAYRRLDDIIGPGNPGRMYEVNLHADPEQFLNWDKPLGAQPGVLQRAPSIPIPEGQMADAIGSEYYKRLQNNLQAEEMKRQLANVDVWPPLGFNSPAMASSALRDAGVPGIRYLDQGSRNAGGWHITPPDQTVSGKWMVKSSDYNSKGMHFDNEAEALAALADKIGGQTHNYAVFNPDIIEILRKYGLAGMLGGGGAAAAMTGQAQAQEPSVPPQNPYPHPPEDYIEPPPGIWR